MSPVQCALAAQLAATLIAFSVFRIVGLPFGSLLLPALAQGMLAAFISHRLGGRGWWLPIHLAFLPLALLATTLGLPPTLWLAGFLLLLAVFWRTDRSQVPLYLSNRPTALALAALLPLQPTRVLDLGCGTGSLLVRLARLRPDCHFTGIEHAPAPWLLARLRSLGVPNLQVRLGDFWRHPLSGYGLIYAFLSPVPMPRLWQQVRDQMAPGALFVANSFPVPGVDPTREIQVDDRRRTRLYCYILPGRATHPN